MSTIELTRLNTQELGSYVMSANSLQGDAKKILFILSLNLSIKAHLDHCAKDVLKNDGMLAKVINDNHNRASKYRRKRM